MSTNNSQSRSLPSVVHAIHSLLGVVTRWGQTIDRNHNTLYRFGAVVPVGERLRVSSNFASNFIEPIAGDRKLSRRAIDPIRNVRERHDETH